MPVREAIEPFPTEWINQAFKRCKSNSQGWAQAVTIYLTCTFVSVVVYWGKHTVIGLLKTLSKGHL